ncbi:hypothetical protein Tco_0149646 [Tanacetum coccineum]
MVSIYENAKLRAQLFDKVFEQVDTTKGTSTNTKFANQSIERKPSLQPVRKNLVVRQPNAFQSERTTSSKSVPQKVMRRMICPNNQSTSKLGTQTQESKYEHDNMDCPKECYGLILSSLLGKKANISPNVGRLIFFKLLCATDEIKDMTFDVYALPCYGLVLFVMALFIYAL